MEVLRFLHYKRQTVRTFDMSGSILLPTVSNKPRVTADEKLDYFKHFLENKPVGTIDFREIMIECNSAIDAGLYSLRIRGRLGCQGALHVHL